MPCRPTPRSILSRRLWLTLAASAAAGLASAQPASSPAQPTVVQMPPSETPAPETAPVVKPSTPAAVATPPVADRSAAPVAPPPEIKAPTAPVRRARYDVAVIEALDKVTAESLRFEAAVGRPVRYRSLVFTVKACERSAPEEAVEDAIAYLTIDSQPRPEAGKPPLAPRQAFKGWMYASSPGLHGLEHPVYDAWLITCRAAAPPSAPASSAPAPRLPAPRTPPTPAR
jgi:hypothetical protein